MRTEYCYTALALALDVAMHADEEAQARYREIWGVAWEPLAERYGDDGYGVLGQEVESAFSKITTIPSESSVWDTNPGRPHHMGR